MNLFLKTKINPMIGAWNFGISNVSQGNSKMAQKEDLGNFVLMQAVGANVAGQIASVIAGAILALVGRF